MPELVAISDDQIIVHREEYRIMEMRIRQLEEAIDLLRSMVDSPDLVDTALATSGYYTEE